MSPSQEAGPAAFYYIVSPQHPMTDDMTRRLDEMIQQVATAVDAGFTGIVAGQHFLTAPYQMLQVVPLLSRLSAEIPQHVRIGPTVLLLPLLNPVEVAEQLATLDIVTKGRSIAGFGIGYRDVEFSAFQRDPKKKVQIFRDALSVIRALWTTEEPVPRTESFGQLEGLVGTLAPVQKPGPPVWIAANADNGVRRAAELGDAWIVNNHAHNDTLKRQIGLYAEELQSHGKSFPEVLPIVKELFVADTREKAVDFARPYLDGKFRSFRKWGQDAQLPAGDRFDLPFEELAKKRFILGTPDDCIEELRYLMQTFSANVFLLRMGWAGMPSNLTVRAVELFGKEVLPAFEKLEF